MGFPHPLMPGASPLSYDLGSVKRLEDAGAAAIVMPSPFEEQVLRGQLATHDSIVSHDETFAEALDYFPRNEEFKLQPHEYLEKVRSIKSCTDLPVLASLNGMSGGRWLDYARLIEPAGAAILISFERIEATCARAGSVPASADRSASQPAPRSARSVGPPVEAATAPRR